MDDEKLGPIQEWLERRRGNSPKLDEEQIRALKLKHAVVSDKPYRLEVLYKPGELVILQGNERGLKELHEALSRLLVSGGHVHYDEPAANLTRSDIPFILQRVDNDGDEAHKID